MYFLLNMVIFHCYVSLPEGFSPQKITFWSWKSPWVAKENHLNQSFHDCFFLAGNCRCKQAKFWGGGRDEGLHSNSFWWILWPHFLKTCHGKRSLGPLSGYQGVFRPVGQCLQVLHSSGITWSLIDHPFEYIAVTTFMGDGANRDTVE